jgi:hypothetical protein
MGCGGIWILIVIYSSKDTIYILFIFCFSSLTGKRRGLTNPRRLCYGQETRTNEAASLLLWERYAKSRTYYIKRDTDYPALVGLLFKLCKWVGKSYKKLYCTKIITKACLLRCKITHRDYSHHWYIRTRLQCGHIFMAWYAKSHTHRL